MVILIKKTHYRHFEIHTVLTDGEREFPLAIRDAVTSNSDRLKEIIKKYESCTLDTDQTILGFVSDAMQSLAIAIDSEK